MHTANLTTYLNDHLAGSVLALELLDHLIDSAPEPSQRATLLQLRAGIADDQHLLKDLLGTFPEGESIFKKAGAWFAEKLALLKLRLAGGSDALLGRLEAFEMLSLGIEGKKGLWHSLQASGIPLPTSFPDGYDLLISTATSQRHCVETLRLSASVEAFKAA